MGPGQIALLIPIVALCIPIVAIVTEHQRKVLELKLRLKGEVPKELQAELAELKNQVAELRDTTTKFDMSFDAAISRLEERVDRVEGRQYEASATPVIGGVAATPAPPPAGPAYHTASSAAVEEQPAVLNVGQGGR